MPQFTLTGPVPGSAAAATGLQPSTVESGVIVQVGSNISAQGVALTPQTPVFVIQPAPGGGSRTLNVSAVGIGAVPTTVTAQLLASYDGGVTWQNYGAALNLVAASVPTEQQIQNMVAGPLFAFVITALTLGGATGVNVDVSLT